MNKSIATLIYFLPEKKEQNIVDLARFAVRRVCNATHPTPVAELLIHNISLIARIVPNSVARQLYDTHTQLTPDSHAQE